MEAIAVVGMACRFPGAPDCESFWKLLRDGREAVVETPADRWDAAALYDPDPDVPGKINTRRGGFLDEVHRFDRDSFKLSTHEASRLDPQHRLLLELAWEALEDAGQPTDRLAGRPVGVFVGLTNFDYLRLALADAFQVDSYSLMGGGLGMAANRLSYHFDLCGPSVALDTACASGLVAVHLACQSLRRGEAILALAGGVSLMLSPEPLIAFTKMKALSPDGRCRAFDAGANGFVFGEGAGLLVLKPLERAEADGDRIRAVVRGGAVNHNGRASKLIAPHGPSQHAVVRQALADAGVAAAQVRYVEAHGTGSLMGDAIEAQALGAALAPGRDRADRCQVGSVKTNLGNLGPAGGVAGLIKVVLALENQQLPASLHFHRPNPYIPFDRLPLGVQDRLGPWPRGAGPLVAGVSAFGVGGTNAHLILQEARPSPRRVPRGPAASSSPACLLPLSAASQQALLDLARRYRDWLADGDTPPLADICYTASVRRCAHDHRLAVVGRSGVEVARQLDEILEGASRGGDARVGQRPARLPRLAFVFSGSGSQWPGMGRGLLDQPAFRQSLEESDQCLRALAPWSLLDVLTDTAHEPRLQEVVVAGPALFAVQVALAALWRSWGVGPDGVIGYGTGELAASYVRGVLTLPEAMRVAVLGFQHGAEKAGPRCACSGGRPTSNLRDRAQAVPFEPALDQLLDEPYGIFLEISPHPVLAGMVGDSTRRQGREAMVLASLQRGKDEQVSLLTSLGAIYRAGWPVDWTRVNPPGRVVPLPSYPWQRQPSWLRDRWEKAPGNAGAGNTHPPVQRRPQHGG